MGDIDLADLMSRAREGDQAALADLIRRFEPQLRMVVRARLPRTLRSRLDSMDIVQSLWRSVLRKPGADLPRFDDSRHLLGFLTAAVRNRVYEQHRQRTRTKKRDLAREEPLYVRRGSREVPREVAGNDPSPSQAVQAQDRLAQLLRGRSPIEKEVVELRKKGWTFEEVADHLGLHESAVRRMLNAIRRCLEARRWP